MPTFPAFIDIKDKKVIVVGGGKVATRKVEKLLNFGPRITVISPKITKELEEFYLSNRIVWKKRKFRMDDLRNAYMVVVAVDNIRLQKRIFSYCKKRRILCNSVDSPDYCNFIFPALVLRGDLVVGISTSGKVPALSSLVRQRIEKVLPKDIGKLLEEAHLLRSSMVKGEERQRLIKDFLKERMEDGI
ncbi:precorrin-2 dehydrogenase/sirohydrochlorin ferrochelatase family protein [Thermocrinis sp.]